MRAVLLTVNSVASLICFCKCYKNINQVSVDRDSTAEALHPICSSLVEYALNESA